MQVGRRRYEPDLLDGKTPVCYARKGDYAECRKLHRKFGTTYFLATQLFSAQIKRRVDALYAFVRVPDEWVDNPAGLTKEQSRKLLQYYRSQLLRGLDGVCPEHPVLRAFCDVVHETGMPLDEPLIFLQAMEQDLDVVRYATYEDLRGYMRGSASAVGIMMCWVIGASPVQAVFSGAQALGEAMQLTNFLRDVGEDSLRGRIYLPKEDMDRFGVTEQDILDGRKTAEFVDLMQFEIRRARSLYEIADNAIPLLPKAGQKPVRLARVLYSRILNRIEAIDYDVMRTRARTTRGEKLSTAIRIGLGLPA